MGGVLTESTPKYVQHDWNLEYTHTLVDALIQEYWSWTCLVPRFPAMPSRTRVPRFYGPRISDPKVYHVAVLALRLRFL
eukprot:5223068-Amphidinium_carterae.1